MVVTVILLTVVVILLSLALLICHGNVEGYRSELKSATETVDRINAALLESGTFNKKLLHDLEAAHKEIEGYIEETANFRCRIDALEKVVNPLSPAEIKFILGRMEDVVDPKQVLPPK